MFKRNDYIYIKKYHGHLLKSDIRRIFQFHAILKPIIYYPDSNIKEEYCILDTGKEQLLKTVNLNTQNTIYYIEHVPWYHRIWCCM